MFFVSISTYKSPQNSSPLKIRKRIFNKNNPASFWARISKVTWDSLNYTESNANSLYETLLTFLTKHVTSFFFLKSENNNAEAKKWYNIYIYI